VRRTSLATACIVLAAIGIASCGQDEAIVGGACKTGLSVCGSECVDLSSDAAHCGSCGHPCLAGDGCLDGVCAGEPTDATVRDAEADASDASSVSDVSTGSDADGSPGSPDGSPFQSESGSGGGDSAPDGTTQNPDASDASGVSDGTATDADANVAPGDATIDADACTPPFDTPDHCGSCANACTGATPRCTPSDAGFVCTPTCAAPLVDCGTGTCIDLTTDPFNCGACALICPSQLCRSSACVGATPGSLVYIGNDYAKPPSSAPQARVFSNAVFAASGSSLEVLAYERYADPNAISSASAILSAAAARFARFDRPTAFYSFTDDPLAPLRAVRALRVRLTSAKLEHRRVDPSLVGAGPIGHHGFFRSKCREPLWTEALAFLTDVFEGRAPRKVRRPSPSLSPFESWDVRDEDLLADLRGCRSRP